jgi:hypothetical protein
MRTALSTSASGCRSAAEEQRNGEDAGGSRLGTTAGEER